MIAKLLPTILCSLWLAVACDPATKPEFSTTPNDSAESGLVSIAYLKSRCNGLSTTIKSDISIRGTVVANDLFGEFHKRVVIVDASGGIEIGIDCEELHRYFPLYANISVTCNGLAVGRVGGKVMLGAKPTGEYTTDRIAESDISKYLFWQKGDVSSVAPRKVTIAELSVEHVSDYVIIEQVHFADEEVGSKWCDESEGEFIESERHLIDFAGNTLPIRISSYCEYAGEKIPSGEGSVCGILDYSADRFFLRIANHEVYFSE